MEKLYFFVDRVSEGRTVLLVGDTEQRLTLPLDRLPKGAAEGDYLLVSFERDEGRGRRAREEIGRLMAGLGDNP